MPESVELIELRIAGLRKRVERNYYIMWSPYADKLVMRGTRHIEKKLYAELCGELIALERAKSLEAERAREQEAERARRVTKRSQLSV